MHVGRACVSYWSFGSVSCSKPVIGNVSTGRRRPRRPRPRRRIMSIPKEPLLALIKRVLLAVAQSWSRHIVHGASFCVGQASVMIE